MPNPLLHFVQALWAGGDIVLSTHAGPAETDINASIRELQVLEVEYRRGLPGTPPAVNDSAAIWALTQLYRACQYLVYRELPVERLRSDLTRPCPELVTSSVCYSVDLSFRFLPDVIRLARASEANSPLAECLYLWATAWPLSSVGVPDLQVDSIDVIAFEPSLFTLYIDRILASNDQSRLSDARVAEAARIALGGFRELCPAIYDVVHQAQMPITP